ncbi:hypothetical protein ACIQVA_33430 [Streptomyces microflavus]|uniref:hypothetical protein n=1 Tax=Streptomyces microflavus TaxID=1919 RepID=UPI0037F9162F
MSTRPAAARNLPALLVALYEQEHTGTVVLSGAPGGRIHLRGGRIAGVETPGAPGVETILLNSGRIDDEAWTAACASGGAVEGTLAAELETRGLLPRQEFEIVCTAAVFDGAFALAFSMPDGWEVTEAVPAPSIGPSVTPRRLAAQTTRRLSVLADLWGAPPVELARTRIRPAADVPVRIPDRYATLLRTANGRRTPRDIAFALGRGVYAVMLDLARMNESGLLHRDRPAPDRGRPSAAPRRRERRSPDGVPAAGTAPLPRRTPGTHHPHRTATP